MVAIGTSIWASDVVQGMIVDLLDGSRVEVAESPRAGHRAITFVSLAGRSWSVDYADRVTVVGYFNP